MEETLHPSRPIAVNRDSERKKSRDSKLLEDCRRGDPEAFELLFELYKDMVYSVAFHLCGNPDLAEDLTQNVFLKLLTRIRQFRGDSEFTTWLYRVVVNAFLDHKRAAKPQVSLEDAMDAPNLRGAAPQDRAVSRRETAEAVRAAMASLSYKLRLPLVLRYVAGLSYDEIASTLEITKGTVASRLSRGHAQMAKKLSYLKDQHED